MLLLPLFDFLTYFQIVNDAILCIGYALFIDTETDVTLSQLNVWSVEQHVTSDRRCDVGVNGDVIGWKELEDADIDGAFIQTPSVCDGMYQMSNEQFNLLSMFIIWVFLTGQLDRSSQRVQL